MEKIIKQTGICPKCGSNKIGHLERVTERPQALVESRTVVGHCRAPLGITRSEWSGFIKVIKESPVGELEAIFSADCGHFEIFIKDPAGIQFEALEGFKWMNP